MANAAAQDKLDYLMIVLKHTEFPKPDFHAVAKDTGVNGANTA